MTRFYAICPLDVLHKHRDVFHAQHGSHYVDLPDGRVLAVVHFSDESGEIAFAAEPGVEILPDPTFESSKALHPKHQAAVAHLSPQGTTVLHLAKAVGKIHPLMKLRSWM